MSEKPLPKTLEAFLKLSPDKFDEGWSEQDGFNEKPNGWSHWVYLKPGWHNGDPGSHIIHECSVLEVKAAWSRVEKCACDDCRRMLKWGKPKTKTVETG